MQAVIDVIVGDSLPTESVEAFNWTDDEVVIRVHVGHYAQETLATSVAPAQAATVATGVLLDLISSLEETADKLRKRINEPRRPDEHYYSELRRMGERLKECWATRGYSL